MCREVESALMSSQAAFHITVALEIIHLRDAAAGARDILSEATAVSRQPPAHGDRGSDWSLYVPRHVDAMIPGS